MTTPRPADVEAAVLQVLKESVNKHGRAVFVSTNRIIYEVSGWTRSFGTWGAWDHVPQNAMLPGATQAQVRNALKRLGKDDLIVCDEKRDQGGFGWACYTDADRAEFEEAAKHDAEQEQRRNAAVELLRTNGFNAELDYKGDIVVS